MATIHEAIERAVAVLRKGGTILYPTDTIWGIGCDPQNEEAVEKVLQIKGRPASKSMLLLAADFEMVGQFVKEIPGQAKMLANQSTKPLTIVYPYAQNLAGNLLPKDQTIGIRITNEKFSKQMIRKFGKPVVSTSANRTGENYPESFNELDAALKKQVDYVVEVKHDYGFGVSPSAIVKVNPDGSISYLRH